MPNYKSGNMWLQHPAPDYWLVTANSVVTKGALVMGGGAALQAKSKYPGCEKHFGKRILDLCGSGGYFGVMLHPEYPIGLFQTKRHYKHNSPVSLIWDSVVDLLVLITENEELTFSLNFPGIGLGGLTKRDVLPLVSHLPESVTVWEWSAEYKT